jgi:carboxymethylenebutenolidase
MTIKTEWKSIERDSGAMGVCLVHPAQKPKLGIVMLQEIFGVNEAMLNKAKTFAEAGFLVALPDLFWRLQPRVELGYGDEDRKAGLGFMQRFDFASGIGDVVATADWLAGQMDGNDRVAFFGFCLGGKLAVVAGARRPSAAVVSFYGVKLDQNLTDFDQITCPLQIHVGDSDAHVPMETVEVLKSHLKGKPAADVFVYPQAQHGFFNSLRTDVFNPGAAAEAMSRTVTMLNGVAVG